MRISLTSVTESKPTVPSTSLHLPDWSEKRFVVLEPDVKWAPAIELEVASQLKASGQSGVVANFDSTSTTREVLMLSEAANTAGLVLLISGMERECLGLLRRLPNLTNRPTVLVVGETKHTELIPVILESGVSSFLLDVKNDIPIAEWCCRILCGDINTQTH